jgi:hypothetical protein
MMIGEEHGCVSDALTYHAQYIASQRGRSSDLRAREHRSRTDDARIVRGELNMSWDNGLVYHQSRWSNEEIL